MDFFGASRGMEVIFAALRATLFSLTDASGMGLLRSLLQNCRKFGNSLSNGGAERDTDLAMRMVACGLVPLVLRVLVSGAATELSNVLHQGLEQPDSAHLHERLQLQAVSMLILRPAMPSYLLALSQWCGHRWRLFQLTGGCRQTAAMCSKKSVSQTPKQGK